MFPPPPVTGPWAPSAASSLQIEDRSGARLRRLQQSDHEHSSCKGKPEGVPETAGACSPSFNGQRAAVVRRHRSQEGASANHGVAVIADSLRHSLQIYLGSLLRQRLQPLRPHVFRSTSRPSAVPRSNRTTSGPSSRCATSSRRRWCRWRRLADEDTAISSGRTRAHALQRLSYRR